MSPGGDHWPSRSSKNEGDKARRIAVNIATLPERVRKS
jgi:hypothetical protein